MERWQTFRQLRRDFDVLRLRFRGGKLSPLVRREAAATASTHPEPDLGFRLVRIEERTQETRDAVSLRLAAVGAPLGPHRAGQFLTLEVVVDGRTYRRAYSISSPEGEPVQVCVKRIDGGVVSTYLTERARVGDTLRVLGPSGAFGVDATDKHTLLLAGGSGITPCIAIAETLLRQGAGRVTLLYGSRSWGDVIFRERLDSLVERYGANFVVDHVTESAHPRATEGRLDAAMVRQRVQKRVNAGMAPATSTALVCGPAPMMDGARTVLSELGFPDVREERFVSARPGAVQRVAGEHTITILHSGKRLETQSTGTLLESGLAAGVEMPFSCSVGGCAACKVKLVEGEVLHDELSCLSDDEKRQGYVLACCAEAATSCTIELPEGGRS